MNLKRQKVTYFVLSALVLLNLPLFLLFVRPEIEADAGETARIDQVRSQLTRRVKTLNGLKDIEKRLNESRDKYRRFSEEYLFPSAKGTSELLETLDAICAEAGLLRNRVTYRLDPEPAFGMQRLAITLPIEGGYANVRNFLNILESESKLVIVDSMALVSEREGTDVLRLDVSLSTLFAVQP
ncbi:MAG: type 4a pilus biogenesis protein PilO [Acidobacteria bacterium]|nr:type 4a pilus biogenesis protein PilO [Acidobacteriota bacterium]MCI0721132.1 type 4a pilus biogenesis protein PilO [Acidobacteriota bacterium]